MELDQAPERRERHCGTKEEAQQEMLAFYRNNFESLQLVRETPLDLFKDWKRKTRKPFPVFPSQDEIH